MVGWDSVEKKKGENVGGWGGEKGGGDAVEGGKLSFATGSN